MENRIFILDECEMQKWKIGNGIWISYIKGVK